MKKFITSSIEIETAVAQIYHEFAKSKVCNEELAAIWKGMARDEEDHANALRLAACVPSEDAFVGIQKSCPNPVDLRELRPSFFFFTLCLASFCEQIIPCCIVNAFTHKMSFSI